MVRPAMHASISMYKMNAEDDRIDAHLRRSDLRPHLTSSQVQKKPMAITRIQPLSAHLHPRAATPSDDDPAAGKQQVYTVWMKSLVLSGHGCTVYGEDGRVAYRVDNYGCSRSHEAYVMDGDGRTLLKLLKKVNACLRRHCRPSLTSDEALYSVANTWVCDSLCRILRRSRHGRATLMAPPVLQAWSRRRAPSDGSASRRPVGS